MGLATVIIRGGHDWTHWPRCRTYATNLLLAGVDIVVVKTLMNHANIATTAEYITHNGEYLKKVVMNV